MLRLIAQRLTALLVALSVFSASAQSVSEPAYANMQRAMGGIIQKATENMGYAATDPRTYGTLRGVGQTTAGAAAAAGTGILVAGSAPAWATILAVAAVGGAVSYGVGITMDAAVKWAFGTGSSPITITIPATAGTGPLVPLGNPLGCSNPTQSTIYNWCVKGGERDPLCMSTAPYTCMTFNMCPGQNNPTLACAPGGTFTGAAQTQTVLQAIGYTFAPATGTETQSNKTLVDAISALTAAQKQQAVSYDAMALMINQMWKKAAAQPGYAGVPYSVTNPVTAAQVQTWQQANPSAYPTVEALVSPVTSGATGFSPSTTTATSTPVSPATSETAPTATNPSTQTSQINLGPDPNIGSPSLEGTPTAQMILAPLIALFPDLKAYNVPGHSGECPKPTFEVFGKSILMDQHCTLFEQQRAALYAAGLLAFTLVALFIVLSA